MYIYIYYSSCDILNKLLPFLYLKVRYLYNKFKKIKLYKYLKYLKYFSITCQSILGHSCIPGDNKNVWKIYILFTYFEHFLDKKFRNIFPSYSQII